MMHTSVGWGRGKFSGAIPYRLVIHHFRVVGHNTYHTAIHLTIKSCGIFRGEPSFGDQLSLKKQNVKISPHVLET